MQQAVLLRIMVSVRRLLLCLQELRNLHDPRASQHQDPVTDAAGYITATFILKNEAQTVTYTVNDDEFTKFILTPRRWGKDQ
ncbi:MAG TPA: hypothetical protein VK543_09895 [Puia sp.]|nr:hypothetical protein [Puia sp.]